MAENEKQNANVVAERSLAVERLRSWSANAIEEVIQFRGETTIVVPRKVLLAVAERCRDPENLNFNLLSDATCLDRFPLEPRYELNYHLVSIPRRDRLRIRVRLAGDDPVVDSLVPIWPGANWLERETYDLYGIQFTGHPDLRRIYLNEEFVGHPLRKDYGKRDEQPIQPYVGPGAKEPRRPH